MRITGVRLEDIDQERFARLLAARVREENTAMPEQVKQVGNFTVAIGQGKPKEGSKNALSPIYRYYLITFLQKHVSSSCGSRMPITPKVA
jgi:hypothetical protein